jgi:hypothetical protein
VQVVSNEADVSRGQAAVALFLAHCECCLVESEMPPWLQSSSTHPIGLMSADGGQSWNHQKDIREYEREAKKKKDSTDDYANETLPRLRKQFDTAQSLMSPNPSLEPVQAMK